MASLRYPDAEDSNQIVGYDVFEVPPIVTQEYAGTLMTFGGGMPSKTSWGTKAWSYSSLFSAKKKFKEVTERL